MKLLAEELLAAMLSISPPGYSVHSQVQIPYCNEDCQKTYLCDNTQDFRCQPPKLNNKLFEEIREKLFLNKLNSNHEFTMIDITKLNKKAEYQSFTRPETYEEGLVRYRIIAEALANASKFSTNAICIAKCQSSDRACKKKCSKIAPWKHDQRSLAFSTMIKMSFESHFRSDVHGGQKRGDCAWRMKNGKIARPNTPGAKFICKAVCLGQKQLVNKDPVTGYSPNDLVGIDYASTYRCSITIMRHLAFSREYCMGRWASGKGHGKDWVTAMFAMYGTGRYCESKSSVERGSKFWLYFNKSWSLDESKEKLLEKAEPTINIFMHSKQQIYWMNPVNLQLKDIIESLKKEKLSFID